MNKLGEHEIEDSIGGGGLTSREPDGYNFYQTQKEVQSMSRLTRWFWVFSVCFVFMVSPLLAAEHGGQEQAGATTAAPSGQEHGGVSSVPAATPAEQLETVAAPEAAPAVPAPVAPPALKPITITFSGEVASVAASENPPMITIQDRYGVKKEIAVPADAKVTAGTASKALADLKAGDKVTVEYTYDVATGKRTAQTINVGDAAAPASS